MDPTMHRAKLDKPGDNDKKVRKLVTELRQAVLHMKATHHKIRRPIQFLLPRSDEGERKE